MKTTIDLPDALLHRAKIVAAQRKTTLKELMITGLDLALRSQNKDSDRNGALERLEKGFRLSGRALSREQMHERR